MSTTFGFTSKQYSSFSSKNPTKFLPSGSYSLYPGDNALMKVSFDGGVSWIVFVNTETSINLLNQSIDIPGLYQGSDVIVKAEINIPDENQKPDIDCRVFDQYIYGNLDLPGLEVDVLCSHTLRRVNWGVTDEYGNFKIAVPPGVYNLVVRGNKVVDHGEFYVMGTVRRRKEDLTNIPIGITLDYARFGLEAEKVIKAGLLDFIFSRFYKIQWGDYMIYDIFISEDKRKNSEDYTYKLYCDSGAVYMYGSFIDHLSIVTDGKQ